MKTEIEVQRASKEAGIPPDRDFRAWADGVLAGREHGNALAIRIVDAAESRRLNSKYRNRDQPTNVLSFAADLPEQVEESLLSAGESLPLGDLVICAAIVATEAEAQGKPLRHHWAHLVVHGLLHLLGHEHDRERDARAMETLERELLAGMGIPDPYEPR